ncbi:MAG: type VI secretion system-associated FHA domain protein TagH [Nitrospirota bacterium]|jgi:type VI secretion system FHA domain protein
MAISLTIQPPAEAGTPPYRFESEADVITIGRGHDNDLVIEDRNRVISTHHARVEFRGNQYWITDVGSTNGSTLNGHPLAANEPEVFVAGDRIGLATYTLHLATDEEGAEVTAKKDFGTRIFVPSEEIPEPAAAAGPDPAMVLRRRVRRLAAALGEASRAHGAERATSLDGILHEHLDPLTDEEASAVVAALRGEFPDREYARLVAERGQAPEAEAEEEVPPPDLGAVRDLPSLLARLLRRTDLPSAPEWQALAAERLERVVVLLLDGLGALLQGRREFEVAYDASATRFHGLGTNRVKLRATGQEPGAVLDYLLDPVECPDADEALGALREATEDCLRHQIGLLHGLKRCVREVLSEVEPKRLEKEAGGEEVKLGPLAMSRKNLPGMKQTAWRNYVEKYQRLATMDEATFNKLLRPVLGRGWLEMQDRGDDDAR